MLLFVIVVVSDLTHPQRKENQMMKTKNGWETTLTTGSYFIISIFTSLFMKLEYYFIISTFLFLNLYLVFSNMSIPLSFFFTNPPPLK
ncbi:hypothetical protein Lalb_Chr08g0240531 [Lupinus albus]|uniref:Uncharacterized protein n=1 Tax=Lupinus albus TaxID=3870 RepID=A0A6A4Q429_LUPAL|nr:hypothetical protein Lalb_Chr08g0240531 [Lupinus albus]